MCSTGSAIEVVSKRYLESGEGRGDIGEIAKFEVTTVWKGPVSQTAFSAPLTTPQAAVSVSLRAEHISSMLFIVGMMVLVLGFVAAQALCLGSRRILPFLARGKLLNLMQRLRDPFHQENRFSPRPGPIQGLLLRKPKEAADVGVPLTLLMCP